MATCRNAETQNYSNHQSKAKPAKERLLARIAEIQQLVGHTQLISLNSVTPPSAKNRIFAKAEWTNPGGSIKDRAALSMITEAVLDGSLTPNKTILDASSGNTAIGYAWIGAALGISVAICIPSNASPERLKLLRAYGAELILTDPLDGTDGAIAKARELANNHPNKYAYLDQYNNPANAKAHYETTGLEIIEQTNGKVSHFVANLGTSGTFMGATRRLKEFKPSIKAVALQPDSPFHGIEGVKHMETALVPGIFDRRAVDEISEISTAKAQEMTRRIAREEGLLVGVSSGAAVLGAIEIARQNPDAIVVTVLPDRGERYLSETFWEAE